MSDIISIKDLCLWYGEHQALFDINMDIPEKSITALIGPSGCGKSTFLKTLNRMNDLIPGVKITGNVAYNGEDIFAPETDVNELRRQIGMVFQKPNPFPMSIYDNVAYGPRTHGIKNSLCGTPPFGMKLKTGLIRTPSVFPADSSSASASRERLRCSRTCCLWMSRLPPWTLYQRQKLRTLPYSLKKNTQ